MGVEIAIAAGKVVFLLLLLVLQVVGMGVFFERKVSAVIQDRIGANRAAIFGFAGMGIINTLVADPVKFLLKEDVVPEGVDRRLHFWAPIIGLFPALVAFAVIPFGDVVEIAGRTIELQVARLDVGVLFVLAMASLGVYGVVLGGWASNNRWSLLGGIRGSAQMISYEIAMGLALVSVVLTYGHLDLQDMVRAQATTADQWWPRWGIFYQPIGMIILMVAGIAESKRIPFDLPESESELVSGYFTEYSGAKHLMFMMADFVEVVLVAALVVTFFLGGWQIPWLGRTGFDFPWGSHLALPSIVVAILQITSFAVKLIALTLFQIIVRWTLPRFRYDQLMKLGWKGLLPLALANVMLTAAVILWAGKHAA
jgi:NADH-quinone oxidoreductase subunit H